MKKNFLGVILASMLVFVLISSCGDGDKGSDDGVYTANIENGKVVYDKVCVACHMTGVAGAAALSNKERWDVSAAKGLETLRGIVLKGNQGEHGVMPERGSCTDCSDHDLFDALGYILHEAGVEAK
jgi:cytochrome c5